MTSDKYLKYFYTYYDHKGIEIENSYVLTSIEGYYEFKSWHDVPSYEDYEDVSKQDIVKSYEQKPYISNELTSTLILVEFEFSKDDKKKKPIDLSIFHIFPNLKEVFIEYFEVNVGNELVFNFDSLSKLKKIEKLTINGAYIKNMVFLSKLPNLKHLTIDNEIVPIK